MYSLINPRPKVEMKQSNVHLKEIITFIALYYKVLRSYNLLKQTNPEINNIKWNVIIHNALP